MIADTIREIIEPDIWAAHGGTAGAISYYQGNLIIRAPNYVHRQIGVDQALRSINRPRLRATPSRPQVGSGGTGSVRPLRGPRRGGLPYPHKDAGIR